MDPKQLAPVLSNVTASADKLAACPTVKEALAAILRDEKITLADQIAITEVEAPPFHEDERAKDLMRRFQALGLTDVTIDQEGNVIARRPGTGNGPTLVLGAHLDTVFPAGTDVHVREENGIYHAPGISDDARGLAVILQVLRTMQEKNIQTIGDICFVCTVGEEGNGDLRGGRFHYRKIPIYSDIRLRPDQILIHNSGCSSHRLRHYQYRCIGDRTLHSNHIYSFDYRPCQQFYLHCSDIRLVRIDRMQVLLYLPV